MWFMLLIHCFSAIVFETIPLRPQVLWVLDTALVVGYQGWTPSPEAFGN